MWKTCHLVHAAKNNLFATSKNHFARPFWFGTIHFFSAKKQAEKQPGNKAAPIKKSEQRFFKMLLRFWIYIFPNPSAQNHCITLNSKPLPRNCSDRALLYWQAWKSSEGPQETTEIPGVYSIDVSAKATVIWSEIHSTDKWHATHYLQCPL